jgi:erythromycin esterase
MIRRGASLVLALALSLLAFSADAAPRRRAAAKHFSYDESTPAGWLSANATVLAGADLLSYTGDLVPFGVMIGSSGVVGLGDSSHGTHEYYTMKLRLIDYLVREKGFDVVGIEGPFPLLNRINAYVQGGPGEGRALVREMRPIYYYLDAEEFLAVVEWMREYNAHRGDRLPVQIAGFDVLQPYPASREVITFLRSVDPPAAVTAESQYQCVTQETIVVDEDCQFTALQVRDALAAREAELTAISSSAAFHEALQNARVVEQSRYGAGQPRDDAMALNTLWLREHRGETRRLILWAHSGHLMKTPSTWSGLEKPMGTTLAETLGSDYFVAATLTAQGGFRYWSGRNSKHVFGEFKLQPATYESYIRQRGMPFLFIPLRGTLPSWLTTPAAYNVSGGGGQITAIDSLPLRYDAAIFIDTTTPLEAIRD